MYVVHIYDFNNNKAYKSEVSIPVEFPKDLELAKNPQIMYNQIRQEYQINRPDWNVEGVKIKVFFTGVSYEKLQPEEFNEINQNHE